MIKLILSHVLTFFLGALVTGLYYWWFVNPTLSARSIAACNQTQFGYVGDWVLNVFFLLIPLTILIGLALIIVSARKK